MKKISKIEIIGGGPAGLYTAILARRLLPNVTVSVTEKNDEGATFGFGVVFSNNALEFLKLDDPETHQLLRPLMESWEDITLNLPSGSVTLDGVGFTAISRLKLIEVLRGRAVTLGVTIRFNTTLKSLDELEADIVIGADGLNSLMRRTLETKFKPKIEYFNNHFAWFGANIPFDTLTQTFIDTSRGALNAHHYRFSPTLSTFIVECDGQTFKSFGFDKMNENKSAATCTELFKKSLQGTELITNNSTWRQFPKLWCENWVYGRNVLIGDAAHSAHFSIGSGTRLAMEDSISLVQSLKNHTDIDEALAAYQSHRQPIAHKIVNAANTSAVWYESFGNKMQLDPIDFAYDYLTRSGRMTDERLLKVAPKFAGAYQKFKSQKK
ncbi:MAG: FAD-dependent monooxygenase [Rhodobacterales bacterium]|jgi:2-polyprenyl-6-methoxyphenol hydroxylase-like FAD-dependent oxidoreductase